MTGFSPVHGLLTLCAALGVIQVLGQLKGTSASDFVWVLSNVNVISTLAIALLAARVRDEPFRAVPAAWFAAWCVPASALTVLACLAPRSAASLVTLVAIAATLLLFKARADHQRGTWTLLAALLFNVTVAPVVFHLIAPNLVEWDARLVVGFGNLVGEEVTLKGTLVEGQDGFGVLLVGACSSFNALSLSVLAYVAYVVWRRGLLRLVDYLWLGPMVVSMVLWNVLRLHLTRQGPASYEYWHSSPEGMGLMNAGMHLLMLGMCLLGGRLCAPRAS